jgi:hypothetical protein
MPLQILGEADLVRIVGGVRRREETVESWCELNGLVSGRQ